MKEYTIGLYNPTIEDDSNIKECSIIFNDLDSLKNHLRPNDIVVLSSSFSLYSFNSKELIRLIDLYNLDIYVIGSKGDKNFNRLNFHTITATNEYIKDNEETIIKLLKK